MKIIMYHYVQRYDQRYPFFRFLDEKNFLKQLNYFKKKFGFLSRLEWEIALHNSDVSNVSDKVILTFDDALYCHYDVVYPILRDLDLWGIFYIPTYPYIKKKMLDVHRIHLLCGAFKGTQLLNALRDMVPDLINFEKPSIFEKLTYRGQKDLDGVTEFKRALNYYCSSSLRGRLLDKICKQLNFCVEPEKFYMSEANIKDIHAAGNIIGAHTVNHPVMSRLGLEHQKFEIRESFRFLRDIGVHNVKTYCHPYGETHDFDQTTLDILDAEGVDYSFSFEERDLKASDLKNNRQVLPRYDCNAFPHGRPS